MVRFSILIPARNEEKYLPGCLEAVARAATPFPDQVEVIVTVNRCTDRTEEIAVAHGARVVHTEARNLAKIRNTAAQWATGDIIVTIDADSRMSPNMLADIDRLLRSGRYIGGGVMMWPERLVAGNRRDGPDASAPGVSASRLRRSLLVLPRTLRGDRRL